MSTKSILGVNEEIHKCLLSYKDNLYTMGLIKSNRLVCFMAGGIYCTFTCVNCILLAERQEMSTNHNRTILSNYINLKYFLLCYGKSCNVDNDR